MGKALGVWFAVVSAFAGFAATMDVTGDVAIAGMHDRVDVEMSASCWSAYPPFDSDYAAHGGSAQHFLWGCFDSGEWRCGIYNNTGGGYSWDHCLKLGGGGLGWCPDGFGLHVVPILDDAGGPGLYLHCDPL